MNSRFSIAAHILTLLASTPGERMTSEWIAGSVGTHPVAIRRQLALFRKAGMVDSKGSAGGGWLLLRPAAEISLAEIHAALGDEVSFRMHAVEPNPDCEVGQGLRTALEPVYAAAHAAVEHSLRGWTLADLLQHAQSLAKSSPPKALV